MISLHLNEITFISTISLKIWIKYKHSVLFHRAPKQNFNLKMIQLYMINELIENSSQKNLLHKEGKI